MNLALQQMILSKSFDPLTSLDDIQELSKKCDYTVVIYHAGKEHMLSFAKLTKNLQEND